MPGAASDVEGGGWVDGWMGEVNEPSFQLQVLRPSSMALTSAAQPTQRIAVSSRGCCCCCCCCSSSSPVCQGKARQASTNHPGQSLPLESLRDVHEASLLLHHGVASCPKCLLVSESTATYHRQSYFVRANHQPTNQPNYLPTYLCWLGQQRK